jgi:hypothetical protein
MKNIQDKDASMRSKLKGRLDPKIASKKILQRCVPRDISILNPRKKIFFERKPR